MDLRKKIFETTHAGKTLTLEVSRLAEQASAAVLGRYGDSAVLVTVTMSEEDKQSNYFPLIVDYEERFYAVGKILGSRFVRREGKASEEAVLSGRIIDRTIRPLFDHRMRREVQVVVTILSLDAEDDLDFVALATASTALAISPVPWAGPVGGVKVVRKNGQLLLNPKNSEIGTDYEFQAFASGPKNRINMIELEGLETKEEDVLAGFELAQKEINALIDFQNTIVAKIGKPKTRVALTEIDADTKAKIMKFLAGKLEPAIYTANKAEHEAAISQLQRELADSLRAEGVEEKVIVAADFEMEAVIGEIIHTNALTHARRPDGRKIDEVRELYGEVAILKKTHGSALFIRGTTQALAVATIAPPGTEQLIETMSFSGKRRFLLHYNFPPYSVGEVGPFRGPGRREIGHGALAEKALRNQIPAKEQFPYTVRVVSEILSSNGSSSMATVCASTLAMMDAGIPMKKPVAGIAMGLMSNKADATNFKVLTDLQGAEDHYGDMDFKVAGTKDGISAIQLDVKITGLTMEMIATTLAQAKKARMEILKMMAGVLPAPRSELSPLAPLIMSLQIEPSQIGSVIGPGGKVINGIIERTGAISIDIDDNGMVYIAGDNKETAQAAFNEVRAIVKEYKIGEIIEGPIIKILEFGAIVQIDSGHDGMIHVSELKQGFVKKVEDVVKLGQVVKAKIVKLDNGRIGLCGSAAHA